MSRQALEEAEDGDLLSETSDEIDAKLRYRDEIIKGGTSEGVDPFAPATLDGGTLLLSRYGFKGTPLARVFDVVFLEPSDQRDLAVLSRQLRSLSIIACLVSGVTASALCIPGIFSKFTKDNQLTVWRTAEMAKRQAMDHLMWTASKIGVSVGVRAGVVTLGLMYAPFVLSAYRGKTSWWEHGVCFAGTMGLYCLPRGPIPMLTAGAIAGSLGTIYGSIYYLVAKQWGCRFQDLYAPD